jgi:uncharacterized repeat protein (TIGR01451 family)
MRHLTALAILVLVVSLDGSRGVLAQTTTWTRQFGTGSLDTGNAVIADGNTVFVAGRAAGALPGQISAGAEDAFLRKYDSSGTEIWTRQFGTSGFDEANDVALDGLGNLYVGGRTVGAFPGQTSTGGVQAFVRKYDGSGNEMWTRQFGTLEPNFVEVIGVAVDGFGNVYVAGDHDGTLSGETTPSSGIDAYVRKYDANGNLLWTRRTGFALEDRGLGVAADALGNVYVAGYVVEATGHDAFLWKLDGAGGETWLRQFGTANTDLAGGVQVDGSGDVYVTGVTAGAFPGEMNAGGFDAFLRKYDAAGNVIWTRQFGSQAPDGEIELSVAVDDSGHAYVAGITEGALPGQTSSRGADVFVRKYDVNGGDVWTHQFGTSGREGGQFAGLVATNSSGSDVYVTGFTDGTFAGESNAGGYDAFLVKIAAPAAVNQPPVANGQNVATAEDAALAVVLSGSDPDGDSLTFQTTPAHGTLSGSAPNLTYTPAPNFNGTDAFSFTVSDGSLTSSAATVSITVNPVNDAPDVVNDVATAPHSSFVNISVLANDTDIDGDSLSIASVTQPGNGRATIGADGTILYTPAPGFRGVDTFTYTASDGAGGTDVATVAVTVKQIEADLSVDLIGPLSAKVGKLVTYTLRIRNFGPDESAAIASSRIPYGLIESISSSQGSCSGALVVSCVLGPIAAFSSAEVRIATLVGLVRMPTPVEVTADVRGPVYVRDRIQSNNSDRLRTTLTPLTADLSVRITDAPDPVQVGAPLTYLMTVRSNLGPFDRVNVVLVDRLPAGVTFVSATPSAGTCDQTSGTVTCSLGSLSPFESATVRVVVIPTRRGTIQNDVSVGGAYDPFPRNNTDMALTRVQ